MEAMIEQYGIGLLQILGGMGMLALLKEIIQPGGILYIILLQYMDGICG